MLLYNAPALPSTILFSWASNCSVVSPGDSLADAGASAGDSRHFVCHAIHSISSITNNLITGMVLDKLRFVITILQIASVLLRFIGRQCKIYVKAAEATCLIYHCFRFFDFIGIHFIEIFATA